MHAGSLQAIFSLFCFCIGIKKVDVSGISALGWYSGCFDISCTNHPQACGVGVADQLLF